MSQTNPIKSVNQETYFNEPVTFFKNVWVGGTLIGDAVGASIDLVSDTTDTESFITFSNTETETGISTLKTSSRIKFNATTGNLSATKFTGDGSGLTGVIAEGSGVVVRNDDAVVGTAATINFGNNLTVSTLSSGIVTITTSDDFVFYGNTGITSAYWDKSDDALKFKDDAKIVFGDSEDFSIYYTEGTGSDGGSVFKHTGPHDMRFQVPSGAHDIVFETTSGDNIAVYNADGSCEHYYRGGSGAGRKIQTASTGIEVTGTVIDDGATHDGDVTFTGNSSNLQWDKSADALEFKDETQARFGNGNDLKISHTMDLSGQNDSNGDSVLAGDDWCSYIEETGTGPLIFKSNGGPSSGAFHWYDTGWRPILKLYSGTNARAALYHGGSEKLLTTTDGIEVTGTVAATSYQGDGSALTGIGSFAGITIQDEGSSLSTLATTLDFVGAGVTATGTGATKTITINGGGGVSAVVDDTSPQLGGNLDLNNKLINGTGGINITGIVTATSLDGILNSSSLTGPLPAIDGSALTGITTGVVVAEEGSNLATTATRLDFVGTGVTATGTGATKTITIAAGGISGVTVEDEGTPLATAGTTLNFVGAGVTATGTGAEKTITINGGGGITEVVSDTSPQLGGNLDLNNKLINGTGGVNITGVITASSISAGSSITAGTISINKDGSNLIQDTDGVVNFGNRIFAETGSQFGNLTFSNGSITDSSGAISFGDENLNTTGNISATSYEGDGSALTGINTLSYTTIVKQYADDADPRTERSGKDSINVNTVSGISTIGIGTTSNAYGNRYIQTTQPSDSESSIGDIWYDTTPGTGISTGVVVKDGGTLVGTAGTIDFGTNLSVSTISAGIVTITATGGGGSLTIQDEGSPLSTAATTLNFVGTGVTATGTGAVKTIAIAAGGIGDVVDDITPQLGGNLDLNSKYITGAGGVNISGIVTASSFVGIGTFESGSGNIIGDLTVSGNVTSGKRFIGQGLNIVGFATAIAFVGDGSNLTGLATGIVVANEGSDLATLGTKLNFVGSGVTATGTGAEKTIEIFGSGGGGIAAVVDDTSPQLGGDLDLNSKLINGTGGVNITGIVTTTTLNANSIFGTTGIHTLASTVSNSKINLDSSGSNSEINISSGGSGGSVNINANSSSGTVKITADVGSGLTKIDGSTGVELYWGGGFSHKKFETTNTGVSISGIVTATSYQGDGSALTGINTGVVVADEGTNLTTTATRLDFVGTGVTVSGIGATKTINIAAGGITEVVSDTSPQLGGNLDLNNKLINGTGGINISGIVTATTYYGDGSNLTGIGSTSGGTPGGSDTQIQYNDSGSFGGSSNLTFENGTTLNAHTVFGTAGIHTLTSSVANSNIDLNSNGSNSQINIDSGGSNSEINISSNGGGGIVNITAGSSTGLVKINAPSGSGVTKIDASKGVELHYGGGFSSKKFETTNAGVNITGVITATTYYGDGSNLTGIGSGGGSGGGGLWVANSAGIHTTVAVGIGTTNPDQTLEIFKPTGTNLVKVSTQANSIVGLEIEKTGSTTQTWRIADGQTTNGSLEFYDVTDSRSVMTFNGDGSVGIGTNNPTAAVTSANTATLAVGIVTANQFYGDGSALTGIGSFGGITVADEGSDLSTIATKLNFVGAGVTASGTGAVKTITINGGGSGGGGGIGTTRVARIYDAKAHNTAAGSPPDTAYHHRTLNTKDDPFGFVTLDPSTNVYFSIPSGTYKINWRAPAHDGNGCRTRLVYANNSSFTSSSEVLGESGYSDTASAESNYYSCGTAILTTTETTYFKIQQAQAAGDWGQACAVGGDEIYTQVFVEDLTTTGGLTEVVNDTSPQLGGNLDLNGHNVTGIGSFNVTGIITANSITAGSISINKNGSNSIEDADGTVNFGNKITAHTGSQFGNINLSNGSITDSSGNISFGDENLTTTGFITATTYYGDGSNLTGIGSTSGSGIGTTRTARVWDQKSSSASAGTPDAYDAWRTRTLNTKEDPTSFVTIESGIDGGDRVFSLPSGSYRINWRAPGNDADHIRTRLRYDTDSAFGSPTDVLGESGLTNTTAEEANYYSCGSKIITITQTTYFAVQQYQNGGTWGDPSEIGDYEIYTQVFIEDLATAVKESGSIGGITIEDEGTPLSTLATSLDFVGSNVTASGTGASKTITVGGVQSLTAGTGLSGGTITETGTINLTNTTVTAGSYDLANITVNAQGRITAASAGVSTTATTKVAYLTDKKNSNVGGGDFESGSWKGRDLTVEQDPSNFVNFIAGGSASTPSAGITTGIWSLSAGTYKIEWTAPATSVDMHQSKLSYATNVGFSTGTGEVLGSNAFSQDSITYNTQDTSTGIAIITIATTTYFRIEHRCYTTNVDSNDTSFGVENGWSDSIYTQVKIEDLATTSLKQPDYVAGTTRVAKLYQEETTGTGGGTYTNPGELGTWKNRTLNSTTDPQSVVTLDSGNVYFTVPAGSYEIKWDTPAYMLGHFQSRLQYDDNSSFSSPTSILGSSEHAPTNGGVLNAQLSSDGIAIFTVTDLTYVRIQIIGSGTPNDANALGVPSNISGATEIYTQVTVEDLATAVKDATDAMSYTTKTGAYTLLATDDQKLIATDGQINLNQNIFSPPDAVTIYNNSALDITITQGTGVTLRLVGTGTTGSRTLAARGIATIVCVGINEFVISGGGVT